MTKPTENIERPDTLLLPESVLLSMGTEPNESDIWCYYYERRANLKKQFERGISIFPRNSVPRVEDYTKNAYYQLAFDN